MIDAYRQLQRATKRDQQCPPKVSISLPVLSLRTFNSVQCTRLEFLTAPRSVVIVFVKYYGELLMERVRAPRDS